MQVRFVILQTSFVDVISFGQYCILLSHYLNVTVICRFVILLSGKRKSGKDFVAERLLPAMGSDAVILRLSGPLKKCYAEQHDLDYEKLMSSDGYKEKYRRDMIRWSEEIRYTGLG